MLVNALKFKKYFLKCKSSTWFFFNHHLLVQELIVYLTLIIYSSKVWRKEEKKIYCKFLISHEYQCSILQLNFCMKSREYKNRKNWNYYFILLPSVGKIKVRFLKNFEICFLRYYTYLRSLQYFLFIKQSNRKTQF